MTKLHPLSNGFKRRPVLLCIMDGVGLSNKKEGNAFYLAKTPCLDSLKQHSLYTPIFTHGHFVGLPKDDVGNSEVGHNTLGAGRVLPQGSSLVNAFLESGLLPESPPWNRVIDNVLKHQSTLHFIGLLSDAGVHSHIAHLKILIQQALKQGVKTIRIHALLDGRDVEPKSAQRYIKDIETFSKEQNKTHQADVAVASCGGRQVVTMDRYEADWKMVERGWQTHVEALGPRFSSAMEGLEAMRQSGKIDQDLDPFIIERGGEPLGPILDDDSVVFFNYRGDRAIEISRAFEDASLSTFHKNKKPRIVYAGMMLYDGDRNIPKHPLVIPHRVEDTLGYYLTETGLSLFAVSETQKYGHVTYFFNGNRSEKYSETLETYIEIPSHSPPFDRKPAMKCQAITDKTIELLKSGRYDMGRINYPNGDMLGHTGNLQATVLSLEAMDTQIGRLVKTMEEIGGVLLVLADHGNSEEMLDEKGEMKTSHTTNPVPLYLYDPLYKGEYVLASGKVWGLSNVASTLCSLLGYEKPPHYDEGLIVFV